MNKLMAQRNQDFRKHIEQESIKAFGIDILKAKEIVFAIGSKGPVLAIQGDQNAVAPKFSKINELAHTRVIGNTILAYPKDDAESLIADEGIDPEKLKSIPGNSPIVLHLLDLSTLKNKHLEKLESANLSIERSGLVRLRVHGEEKSLDKAKIFYNEFVSKFGDKLPESLDIENESLLFLLDTFLASISTKRLSPETIEFKLLLPRAFTQSSPTKVGFLAAVLAKQFQKFIKGSKQSEANVNLAKIRNALKTGAQCTPPSIPPVSSVVPKDGRKVISSLSDPRWILLGLEGENAKNYFSYRVEQVNSDTLVFIAEADFDSSSPETHIESFSATFTGKPTQKGECEVLISETKTQNKFE